MIQDFYALYTYIGMGLLAGVSFWAILAIVAVVAHVRSKR